jgi:holin-like protein
MSADLSLTVSPSSAALRKACAVVAQVVLIALLWLGADALSRRLLPLVPSSLLGLGLALAGLGLGILRRNWLAVGADWLIGEMLLFFVPAVVALVQYADMIRNYGLAILIVILLSTICVMVCTAVAVDIAWRFQARKAQDQVA